MQHTERVFYFNPDQDRYDNNNVQSLNQETSHFREEGRSTKPWKKQTQFAERISTSTNTDPMSKSSQETLTFWRRRRKDPKMQRRGFYYKMTMSKASRNKSHTCIKDGTQPQPWNPSHLYRDFRLHEEESFFRGKNQEGRTDSSCSCTTGLLLIIIAWWQKLR